MVPTVRPSPNTSIFAPTRWGVEPVVETIVTSAAGSPRSSAAATAAKTSRFTRDDYTGQEGRERRRAGPIFIPPILSLKPILPSSVQIALLQRLGSGDKRLVDNFRTVRRCQFAGFGVDVGE